MKYAIDFGTSNTIVARRGASGQGECVAVPLVSATGLGVPVIPSVIYVKDAGKGSVYVGQDVRDRGLDVQSDRRFFRGFKRGIGQPIGYLPELDGQRLDCGTLGQWFLREVVGTLGEAESLVLTVPIDTYEPYVNWLVSVAQTTTAAQIRIIDEPTAAALGYGISVEQPRLLVIDFGGGTLDMVLVERLPPDRTWGWGQLLKWGNRTDGRGQPRAKVLAKSGQNLGGMDIDQWILEYFQQHQGITPNSLTLRLAERLKIQLSSQTSAEEVYFDEETFTARGLALHRGQLGEILTQRGFFDRLNRGLTQVKQQAQAKQVALSDIDRVLLVGGTCMMPAVQDWVAQHFSSDRIELDKPLEAIALGALQDADWEMEDILYHSYGMRYWDKRLQRQHWHPLIAAGQKYPLDRAVEIVLGASTIDQAAIELVMGELGETMAEVVFNQGNLVSQLLGEERLTAFALNDRQATIAPLVPPGTPGFDRVRVEFQVDSQRTLRITVTDLLTQTIVLRDQPVIQLL